MERLCIASADLSYTHYGYNHLVPLFSNTMAICAFNVTHTLQGGMGYLPPVAGRGGNRLNASERVPSSPTTVFQQAPHGRNLTGDNRNSQGKECLTSDSNLSLLHKSRCLPFCGAFCALSPLLADRDSLAPVDATNAVIPSMTAAYSG